jgi:hypothetical protein
MAMKSIAVVPVVLLCWGAWASADGAGWMQISAPDTAPGRDNHACCWDSANDHIYLYGGSDNSGNHYVSFCASYDPVTRTWYDEAPMTTARGYIKGICCQGRLYAIGGVTNGGQVLSSCEVYNQSASEWSPIAPLPQPTYGYQAVVFHDSLIYVTGGADSGGNLTCNAWIYDPRADAWTASDSMLVAGGFGDACVVGDSIYIVGASQGNAQIDTFMRIGEINHRFPGILAWAWGPAMPAPRYDGPVVALDRKVYWFGGYQRGNPTNAGYCYDPAAGDITGLPPYPTGVASCCLAAVRTTRGEIYGLGGDEGNGGPPAGYWQYNVPGFYDVAPSVIVSPPVGVDSGQTVVPLVLVSNLGRDTERFPVMLRIDRTWVDYETTRIAPDDTASVTFHSWQVPSSGAQILRCSTMLAGDEQPENDLLCETLDAARFDASILSVHQPDSIPEGSFQPMATVKNNGRAPGLVLVHWWALQDDTLPVYVQSESVYLAANVTRNVAFPSWNAVRGSYLAKIFMTCGNRVCHDTVQQRFTVLAEGIMESPGGEPASRDIDLKVSSPIDGHSPVRVLYSLPHAADIGLSLYDAAGKLRAVLERNRSPAGAYSMTLDIARLVNSGVFFVQLRARAASGAEAELVVTRKMVVTGRAK